MARLFRWRAASAWSSAVNLRRDRTQLYANAGYAWPQNEPQVMRKVASCFDDDVMRPRACEHSLAQERSSVTHKCIIDVHARINGLYAKIKSWRGWPSLGTAGAQ